jgi:hypothetical protein
MLFLVKSHLDQALPSPERHQPNQRIHMRFDKAFLVTVDSELFGEATAVGRNISAGGMLIEMGSPLPLGSIVRVYFRLPRQDGTIDEIVARAEVKHQYCLNFTGNGEAASARGIGLRFVDFADRCSLAAYEHLH